MNPRIREVTPTDDYRLNLVFTNGEQFTPSCPNGCRCETNTLGVPPSGGLFRRPLKSGTPNIAVSIQGVNCSQLLDFGVFAELKDKIYFMRARALDGTVS